MASKVKKYFLYGVKFCARLGKNKAYFRVHMGVEYKNEDTAYQCLWFKFIPQIMYWKPPPISSVNGILRLSL